MTPEPNDSLTVEWSPDKGSRRRIRFESRSDGRWDRHEDEWNGCQWRPVGHEIVTDVVITEEDGVSP